MNQKPRERGSRPAAVSRLEDEMKIILSRKGFDSANGGAASPLFDDGTAVSLPIPAGRGAPARFDQLSAPGTPHDGDLGTLAEALTRGRIGGQHRCHLDPDLAAGSGPEVDHWQAAFGQAGAAQRHLEAERVGRGDLFLFFGWFRDVEPAENGWRYRRKTPGKTPDVHRLFGWLQVGDILPVGERTEAARECHPGLARHPHVWSSWDKTNTIYTAANELHLAGAPAGTPGAGLFGADPERALQLTADDARTRSEWRLPKAFRPRAGRKGLSYHRDSGRWSGSGTSTRLRAVGRGQEFVLDAAETEATAWAARLWTATATGLR